MFTEHIRDVAPTDRWTKAKEILTGFGIEDPFAAVDFMQQDGWSVEANSWHLGSALLTFTEAEERDRGRLRLRLKFMASWPGFMSESDEPIFSCSACLLTRGYEQEIGCAGIESPQGMTVSGGVITIESETQKQSLTVSRVVVTSTLDGSISYVKRTLS